MAHDLTIDRLRSYLDHKDAYESEADSDMLAMTLAAAIRFCQRYCNLAELVPPVDADLADAIYTAAARQWRAAAV